LLDCSPPCATCQGTATTCTSCPEEAPHLSGGTCISISPLVTEMISTVSGVSSAGATAVTVVASGGAMGILFGVLHKLLGYIKYLDIAYSPKLASVLDSWNSELISLHVMPDLPEVLQEQLISKPIPVIFVKREIAPTFLENFWEEMIFLFVAIVCYISFTLLVQIFSKQGKSKILLKIFKYVRLSILNYFISQVYFSLGDIVTFFTLNVKFFKNGTLTAFMSLLLAFICLIFGAGFLIFHFLILKGLNNFTSSQLGTNKKEKFLKKYQEFEILFEQWNENSSLKSAYLFLFTLRDIGLNIVISNLYEHPLIQASLFVGMTSAFLLYLILKRPFKKLSENLQQISLEIIVVIIFTFVLLMKSLETTNEWETRNQRLGDVVVILAIIFNFASLVFVIFQTACIIYEYYLRLKAWKEKRLNSMKVLDKNKLIVEKIDQRRFSSNKRTGSSHFTKTQITSSTNSTHNISLNSSNDQLLPQIKGRDRFENRLRSKNREKFVALLDKIKTSNLSNYSDPQNLGSNEIIPSSLNSKDQIYISGISPFFMRQNQDYLSNNVFEQDALSFPKMDNQGLICLQKFQAKTASKKTMREELN